MNDVGCGFIAVIALVVVVFMVASALLMALLIMTVWNWAVPDHQMSYLVALAVSVLFTAVFGGRVSVAR